ncbi:MAG: hypothetical protein NTV29_14115 [Planctomycetota bacterium]|nr:hypothetical protein [Planctomycetota bacterium]
MDGEDFELVIKNQSSTGLQAILINQGQSDPFAFFFGHKISPQEYSGSLVFLDPAESLEDLPWEPVVLNIAGILDANLGLQLLDVEVLCRFDPTEVSQPKMRQNRISRTTVDFESYELQIEAIETEVFQQFEQRGELPEDSSYWPVAKAECLMDSQPPVIAVLMQDESLCTDEHTQHFVNWLAHSMQWPKDIQVTVCMPARSLGRLELEIPSES